MTGELVSWLSRALDRLERFANEQNAGGPTAVWHVYADGEDYGGEPCTIRDSKGDVEATLDDPGIGQHIALHDPRAVLARVEAERAVLALHGTGGHSCRSRTAEWLGEQGNTSYGEGRTCEVVRLLAWGHRHDAPDYDMAWAPEGVTANA